MIWYKITNNSWYAIKPNQTVGALTDTTTPGKRGLGSNSNEEKLYTPQSLETGCSLCHIQDTPPFLEGLENAVRIF